MPRRANVASDVPVPVSTRERTAALWPTAANAQQGSSLAAAPVARRRNALGKTCLLHTLRRRLDRDASEAASLDAGFRSCQSSTVRTSWWNPLSQLPVDRRHLSLLEHASLAPVDPAARCFTFDLQDLVGHRTDRLGDLIAEAYRDHARIEHGVRRYAEGTGFALPDSIEGTARRRAAAKIPTPGMTAVRHLDPARAELAEILINHCLETQHAVVFPARRLRHKDNVQLAMRGIDDVGIRRDPVTGRVAAVIVEVKASTEDRSPPQVLDRKGSGLIDQLTDRLADNEQLYRALNWVEEHAVEGRADVALEALAAYEAGELELVAAPGLVRQADCCGDDEFGRYADEDVHPPHKVVCNLIRIEGDLRLVVLDAFFSARFLA